MTREFNVAVRDREHEAQDLEYPYEITLDGRTCTYRKPEDGEYAVLLANIGRFRSVADKVGAAVDLFHDVYEPEDAHWLIERLMDPAEPEFDFSHVIGLLEVMVEEWTGRPTQRSSGSTPRRPKTGSGSSRRTSASTS